LCRGVIRIETGLCQRSSRPLRHRKKRRVWNLVNFTHSGPLHERRIDRHKDGSVKARGHVIDDVLTGYWEWFRKDGTKMRSGYFEDGRQVGEWTTYDAKGRVVNVTKMKSP
jgi:antitoxin component YwqK of YwqJK toxin-antitoxin module